MEGGAVEGYIHIMQGSCEMQLRSCVRARPLFGHTGKDVLKKSNTTLLWVFWPNKAACAPPELRTIRQAGQGRSVKQISSSIWARVVSFSL